MSASFKIENQAQGVEIEAFTSVHDMILSAIQEYGQKATLRQIYQACQQRGRIAYKRQGGSRLITQNDHWKSQIRHALYTSERFVRVDNQDDFWTVSSRHMQQIPKTVKVYTRPDQEVNNSHSQDMDRQLQKLQESTPFKSSQDNVNERSVQLHSTKRTPVNQSNSLDGSQQHKKKKSKGQLRPGFKGSDTKNAFNIQDTSFRQQPGQSQMHKGTNISSNTAMPSSSLSFLEQIQKYGLPQGLKDAKQSDIPKGILQHLGTSAQQQQFLGSSNKNMLPQQPYSQRNLKNLDFQQGQRQLSDGPFSPKKTLFPSPQSQQDKVQTQERLHILESIQDQNPTYNNQSNNLDRLAQNMPYQRPDVRMSDYYQQSHQQSHQQSRQQQNEASRQLYTNPNTPEMKLIMDLAEKDMLKSEILDDLSKQFPQFGRLLQQFKEDFGKFMYQQKPRKQTINEFKNYQNSIKDQNRLSNDTKQKYESVKNAAQEFGLQKQQSFSSPNTKASFVELNRSNLKNAQGTSNLIQQYQDQQALRKQVNSQNTQPSPIIDESNSVSPLRWISDFNIESAANFDTFLNLDSKDRQYLLKLLPECDRAGGAISIQKLFTSQNYLRGCKQLKKLLASQDMIQLMQYQDPQYKVLTQILAQLIEQESHNSGTPKSTSVLKNLANQSQINTNQPTMDKQKQNTGNYQKMNIETNQKSNIQSDNGSDKVNIKTESNNKVASNKQQQNNQPQIITRQMEKNMPALRGQNVLKLEDNESKGNSIDPKSVGQEPNNNNNNQPMQYSLRSRSNGNRSHNSPIKPSIAMNVANRSQEAPIRSRLKAAAKAQELAEQQARGQQQQNNKHPNANNDAVTFNEPQGTKSKASHDSQSKQLQPQQQPQLNKGQALNQGNPALLQDAFKQLGQPKLGMDDRIFEDFQHLINRKNCSQQGQNSHDRSYEQNLKSLLGPSKQSQNSNPLQQLQKYLQNYPQSSDKGVRQEQRGRNNLFDGIKNINNSESLKKMANNSINKSNDNQKMEVDDKMGLKIEDDNYDLTRLFQQALQKQSGCNKYQNNSQEYEASQVVQQQSSKPLQTNQINSNINNNNNNEIGSNPKLKLRSQKHKRQNDTANIKDDGNTVLSGRQEDKDSFDGTFKKARTEAMKDNRDELNEAQINSLQHFDSLVNKSCNNNNNNTNNNNYMSSNWKLFDQVASHAMSSENFAKSSNNVLSQTHYTGGGLSTIYNGHPNNTFKNINYNNCSGTAQIASNNQPELQDIDADDHSQFQGHVTRGLIKETAKAVFNTINKELNAEEIANIMSREFAFMLGQNSNLITTDTIEACLTGDLKSLKSKSQFIAYEGGKYGLREWVNNNAVQIS